jgi:Auxin binding protein
MFQHTPVGRPRELGLTRLQTRLAGDKVPFIRHSCKLVRMELQGGDVVFSGHTKREGFSLRGSKVVEATAMQVKVHRRETVGGAVDHKDLVVTVILDAKLVG